MPLVKWVIGWFVLSSFTPCWMIHGTVHNRHRVNWENTIVNTLTSLAISFTTTERMLPISTVNSPRKTPFRVFCSVLIFGGLGWISMCGLCRSRLPECFYQKILPKILFHCLIVWTAMFTLFKNIKKNIKFFLDCK